MPEEQKIIIKTWGENNHGRFFRCKESIINMT
uniref:Uncharacterized protein n=1 Tax=Anguilla anguilla TaxID=7936 RepID=A0A0E9PKW2_ANGAN